MVRMWNMVWLFTFASMAGFLLESGESLLSLGYVQNRQGLLYGPFAPVYGAGAVALALLWPLVKGRSLAWAFLLAAVAGAGVEYLWAACQERWFGVSFWDYSHFRFHLNGRVNLPFTLLWGLLGLFFWYKIWPQLRQLPLTSSRSVSLIGLLLALFFVGNSLWSAAALTRQAQRQQGIAAFSPLTVYLDTVWSDQALQEQFPTMRQVQKEQTH